MSRLGRAPIAMAHRGFSGAAGHSVENSMRAFDAAVNLGYEWVETDVHATADGVVLAFHDTTLDRVTDATGVIAELPWTSVQQARINGVEPILRLDDLLARHPELNLNIDVKADEAVSPLIECIERHAAHGRVRITSFSEKRRRRTLSGLNRPVRTSPGQELMAALWVSAHLPLVGKRLFKQLAGGVDALQIPERFGRLRVLDRKLLDSAHSAGVEVHIWTVNEPTEMKRLLDLGVDGLITDRADLLKEVLRGRRLWKGSDRTDETASLHTEQGTSS